MTPDRTRSRPFREQELLIEYASLRRPRHCPSGVYVSLSPDSHAVWEGLLCLRSGPYASAVFKFEMSFHDYPDRCPRLRFLSEVRHPLVSPEGDFALDWRVVGGWQADGRYPVPALLHHLKAAFKESGLAGLTEDKCLDRECLETLRSSRPLFDKLARQCALVSRSGATLYRDADTRGLRCVEEDGISYERLMEGIARYCDAQGLT